MPERPVRIELFVRQALGDATSDVHERSFLAEAEARAQHADHAEALGDVGLNTEHVWQLETRHDGLHLGDATACSYAADILDDTLGKPSEEHAK